MLLPNILCPVPPDFPLCDSISSGYSGDKLGCVVLQFVACLAHSASNPAHENTLQELSTYQSLAGGRGAGGRSSSKVPLSGVIYCCSAETDDILFRGRKHRLLPLSSVLPGGTKELRAAESNETAHYLYVSSSRRDTQTVHRQIDPSVNGELWIIRSIFGTVRQPCATDGPQMLLRGASIDRTWTN